MRGVPRIPKPYLPRCKLDLSMGYKNAWSTMTQPLGSTMIPDAGPSSFVQIPERGKMFVVERVYIYLCVCVIYTCVCVCAHLTMIGDLCNLQIGSGSLLVRSLSFLQPPLPTGSCLESCSWALAASGSASTSKSNFTDPPWSPPSASTAMRELYLHIPKSQP